ncbi:MAG: hypothetical protein RBS89_02690 [Candidatus Delongbacteria bacterium]|jgi:hypothetical protein|nr:hypothetical protein [Candidatus Delongbacteria bacterium]
MKNILQNNKTQIAILIILTVIAYLPSFKGVWQYDDLPVIVNNEWIRNGIFNPEFFKGNTFFRSLSYISFSLNYLTGGYEIFGYHIVNLIIHLLAGIFLYLFIHELVVTTGLKNGYGTENNKAKITAFLTALFWLTAPINVQAVTYIVQRMTSLAGLFYFCSLYLYLKLRTHRVRYGNTNKKLLSGLIISVIFALMSKQNSLLLMPSVLYIEWSFFREASLRKVKKYTLIAFLSIPVIITIIYFFYSSGTDTNLWSLFQNNYTNREFSPLQRLFIEPKILLHYISLVMFPFVGRFHLLYSFDWLNAPYQVMPYVSIFLIAAAFVFSVIPANVKKYKIVSFGIFFFLINHLMESSVIGLQLAAEHRNYVPSTGIFLILSTGILGLGEKLRNAKPAYLFTGLFILFSILNTWVLNLKYHENNCNAVYDYNEEYNGLDYEIVSRAVDKLLEEEDYSGAYRIMSLEYEAITKNPHRHKFFRNYINHSIRFLKYYIFLHYISSGFNIENTLSFIENKFIRDVGGFWINMEVKKNYDNIFNYLYIKSLLKKYGVIDETVYQKSLQYDSKIIDIYFYLKFKNYEEFVKYNKAEIAKLEGIELTENERSVLELIK